ncbi:hypothetical protein [Streptomyces sp. VRA16 Mangrove soil]|uniref:hypothetical protein n=1 Tax=Streptomyces sp. VRA16 Mangrove soil TaxID=2817434 RepID=UPI001A9E1393|nr:hypothetical protein [Streptomyces sp. VRA16 Mangrove soil]MBO1334127.1 hypothetical protein [Streptomyces sp. VRA16 Mangrove soil]
MLTYQDVTTINIGALTTTATAWDDMADGLKDVEGVYNSKVLKVATGGTWKGEAATAAHAQFAATSRQYQDAQKEARAIASLLRDAHGQFTHLINEVKRIVEGAGKNDLTVNAQGEALYDYSKLTPYRHDENYGEYVSKAKKAEEAWTKKIKEAVRAVDDADQGVKLALREAAGIKDLFGRMADAALGQGHTFNGKAVGDIEVYEAREAKAYADEILAGKKPSDPAEWERLMRDNSDDKIFSQTFLDSLGPDKALKLTAGLDDLAYSDDTGNKKTYLTINGGIADSLATATNVPDFRDANGRTLKYGSRAYNDAMLNWLQSDDSKFYRSWRDGLREVGDDKYDLKVAGDAISSPTAKGHGQQVRGYQLLATMMKQGHNDFDPEFTSAVTDDMIRMEKEQPGIWNLYGAGFTGKDNGGWFANDPVDASLEVMSRTPEGAAHYLDTGTAYGKEHFDYLVGNGEGSRDWDLINQTRGEGIGGNVEVDAGAKLDDDNRRGLGDALTAAATGHDPNSNAPGPDHHTATNDRIFRSALSTFADQGDDMPANLRDSMAKIMTSHGDEVYVAMSDPSGKRLDASGVNLDPGQVMEVTKQVSRSEHSYGLLHEGMNYAITSDINDASRAPEDTLNSAGYAVGFMEEARYNALKGDQHDYTWDKAWSYHASGALLNFIPGVGDIAQRGADVVTTAWIMDEQQHQADELTDNNQATYETRKNQLNAIADQWHAANTDWASTHTGYSPDDGVYKQIAAAANDGNKLADGLAGDQ